MTGGSQRDNEPVLDSKESNSSRRSDMLAALRLSLISPTVSSIWARMADSLAFRLGPW